jgi:hypothetical protein
LILICIEKIQEFYSLAIKEREKKLNNKWFSLNKFIIKSKHI